MSTKPTDHGPEVCFQSVILICGGKASFFLSLETFEEKGKTKN